MQNMSLLTLPKYSITQREGISGVRHNIQSLNKHIVDLKSDMRFKNADIICLTETWLRSEQNIDALSLNGFRLYHAARENLYTDKSSELAKLQTAKGGGVAVYVNGSGQEKKIISLSGTNVESIGVKFDSFDSLSSKFIQRISFPK